jgi:AcrR family transcriptional regulator
VPPTTNRHELRRLDTRESLRRVAVEQFTQQGYDAVTVAALAKAAGVTERTFYRHFPTKESVLFQDYENHLDWLSTALAMRPRTEDIFDSILASVQAFPHDAEIVRQAALLRASLINGDKIVSHLRVVQASFGSVITDFIKSRHADHPDIELFARVAGGAVAAGLVTAVEVWGQGGCAEDLGTLVNRSMEFMKSGLVVTM